MLCATTYFPLEQKNSKDFGSFFLRVRRLGGSTSDSRSLSFIWLVGEQVTCSGVPTDNPFLTPCFWGSVIYLIAFLISWFIMKKDKEGGTIRTASSQK